jgi:DNA-directed RNA polymerase specialized sigma24 family protein
VTFEEYARARLGPLLRLARGMTLDSALAEDLVQDLLIKVHRRWAQISRLDAPDVYVRRMLINEYISWRRKWGRIQPAATI